MENEPKCVRMMHHPYVGLLALATLQSLVRSRHHQSKSFMREEAGHAS